MKERSTVKNRRKGLTFMLLAPMRMAWRAGSLERMSLASPGA